MRRGGKTYRDAQGSMSLHIAIALPLNYSLNLPNLHNPCRDILKAYFRLDLDFFRPTTLTVHIFG